MIEEIILNFVQANFPKLNPRRDGHIIYIDCGNIYNYGLEGLVKLRMDYNNYQSIDVYYDNPQFLDVIRETLICQYNKNAYDQSGPRYYRKTSSY